MHTEISPSGTLKRPILNVLNRLFILLIVFPGLVADKTNSYPIAFLCAGGIEAVGVLILLIFVCVRRVEFSQTKIQTDSENSSSTALLVIEKETVL